MAQLEIKADQISQEWVIGSTNVGRRPLSLWACLHMVKYFSNFRNFIWHAIANLLKTSTEPVATLALRTM